MKTTENHVKVLEFVAANPKATPNAIAEGTGIFKLNVHRVAKQLTESGYLQMSEKDGVKTFTATGVALAQVDKKEEEQIEALTPKEVIKAGSKDISKYEFEKVLYGKGPLALALIRKVVQLKNPTLKELLAMFPDEIVPPYGVIKPISEAKTMSEKKRRFFIADDQVIKLKDKKVVACTNQMTTERLMKIVAVARKNGVKI